MKLENTTSHTKVRHRNEINTTFSLLPLSARRILFMAIAQLDSKKMIPDSDTFKITASEYAFIADIDVSVAYKQLKEGVEELQRSVLSIQKSKLLEPFKRAGDPMLPNAKSKSPKDTFRMLNITEYCDYSESGAFVELKFTRTMEPYISMLAGGYTTQVLLSAARLSEPNASALYQLLRKNISLGKVNYFEISINELKDELNLFTVQKNEKSYSYPEFKDFKRYVLLKSIKTILSVTEFVSLDFEVSKKIQRKAHILKFFYSINKETSVDDNQ